MRIQDAHRMIHPNQRSHSSQSHLKKLFLERKGELRLWKYERVHSKRAQRGLYPTLLCPWQEKHVAGRAGGKKHVSESPWVGYLM